MMTKKKRLAAALLATALTTPALADEPRWLTLRYSEHAETDLTIGAGVVTELTLHHGERVRGEEFVGEVLDGGSGQYQLWDHNALSAGSGAQQTVHLTFVPSRPGLMANVVVATSERVYRLRLTSTSSTRPTYAEFVYDSPVAPRATPKPTPAPGPLVQMDAACAAMPAGERYATDAQPAEWRPVRVCHSRSRTFIQLAPSATVPVDVPIPRQVTASGDQAVVWSYDSASRIYGVDLVPDELVLTIKQGKKTERLRVQRQFITPPAPVALHPMPSPSPVSVSIYPDLKGER